MSRDSHGKITAAGTITVASGLSVETLDINSSNAYTFSGSSALTLDNSPAGGPAGTPAQILSAGANHIILVPLTLNSNLNVSVAAAR